MLLTWERTCRRLVAWPFEIRTSPRHPRLASLCTHLAWRFLRPGASWFSKHHCSPLSLASSWEHIAERRAFDLAKFASYCSGGTDCRHFVKEKGKPLPGVPLCPKLRSWSCWREFQDWPAKRWRRHAFVRENHLPLLAWRSMPGSPLFIKRLRFLRGGEAGTSWGHQKQLRIEKEKFKEGTSSVAIVW